MRVCARSTGRLGPLGELGAEVKYLDAAMPKQLPQIMSGMRGGLCLYSVPPIGSIPPGDGPRKARIVQVTFGRGGSVKWNEEQRRFLHQRVRILALVLHLDMALAGARALGVFDSWLKLLPGSKVGLIGGCAALSLLSIWLLAQKAPSFETLRRFEAALVVAALVILTSWSYSWLVKGVSLTGRFA